VIVNFIGTFLAALAKGHMRSPKRLITTLALLLACLSTNIAVAYPLDLDPTFGNGGNVVVPHFGAIPGFDDPSAIGYWNIPTKIALQPDGKVLLAIEVRECAPEPPLGGGCQLGRYIALVRYNSDGSMDSSFGKNGVVTNPGYSSSFGGGPLLGALLIQADGKIVLEAASQDNTLLRLDSSGSADTSFGNAGLATLPQLAFLHLPLQQADGKLLLAGGFYDTSGLDVRVAVGRLNADGSLDTSYGALGIASIPIIDALGLAATAGALQSDGKLVVIGPINYSGPQFSAVFVARFNTDGTPDATFGAGNGLVATSFPATPHYSPGPLAVRQQANGKLLVVGTQGTLPEGPAGIALLQLNADGSLDDSFGVSGRIITRKVTGPDGFNAAAWQSDGSVVLTYFSVARLSPDGAPDPGFGDCGRRQPTTVTGLLLAMQPDDKLLVSGQSLLPDASVFTAENFLSRLRGDHSTTVFFNSDGPNPARAGDAVTLNARVVGNTTVGGTVTFKDGNLAIPACSAVPVSASGPGSYSASCQAQGMGLGSHVLTAHYDGEPANPESTSCPVVQFVDPPDRTTAIEYYHDVFDHYFITTLPEEVAALDSGYFQGWGRTGQTFQVHPLDQLAGSAPVCRFFSGQTFAPKSSHFFTPLASECAAVKQNPDWMFEGLVFGLDLPAADGTCTAGGQTSLYRLYNNGQGGAPNHRYLTDEGVFYAMIGSDGWIPEGFGVGVIGCVTK